MKFVIVEEDMRDEMKKHSDPDDRGVIFNKATGPEIN